MTILHIDFETRSPVNLLTDGAFKYAQRADIICMAYAFDDGPVEIWKPMEHEDFPDAVRAHIDNDGECWAHNAEFEYHIFNACAPAFAPGAHQWTCTAAMARACALPGSLEMLARCLGTNAQKDARGKELIQQLCIAKSVVAGVPLYDEDPDALNEMYEYCIQDVITERECGDCLREFSPDEHDDFLVNLMINEHGIPVDLELAELSTKYAEGERADLVERIDAVSYGELHKATGVGLTNWVYDRLNVEQQKLMHPNDTDKISLDKTIRAQLLELKNEIEPEVYAVIDYSNQASKSSVAKFRGMQKREVGGRVHGAYLLNGAGQTGRYSSTGLQLHNFPRISMEDPDYIIERMVDGYSIHTPGDDTMSVLSKMLRPAILAPEGDWLAWADYSAIEGRVLPWLTLDDQAQDKIDLYAAGEAVYVHTAAQMFHMDRARVTDTIRQQGKIAELSLGFAGGAGALKSMARNYGVTFTDNQAEHIKIGWRAANPWASTFWRALERAASLAIRNPETMIPCGRIHYLYTPGVLHDALWCQLPSGRLICYPGARLENVDGLFGPQTVITAIKGNKRPKKGEKEWPRVTLWHGILCENITQATAADLLRRSLRMLVLDHDAPVIGHTHDEIILECRASKASGDVERWTRTMRDVMETGPDWATGLPLAVKTGDGYRYGK